MKIPSQYQGPGVRDQLAVGHHNEFSDQIGPNPTNSVAQIRPNCPEMLRSQFWLQKKDLGASVGAIGMVFRDLSGRSRPDSKNPEKKLPFLSCLFLKGTPMANSYTPYKRLAPPISGWRFIELPVLLCFALTMASARNTTHNASHQGGSRARVSCLELVCRVDFLSARRSITPRHGTRSQRVLMVPWCQGTQCAVRLCHGAMVPCYQGAIVPWCYRTVIL